MNSYRIHYNLVSNDGFSCLLSAKIQMLKTLCTLQLEFDRKPVKEPIYSWQSMHLELRDYRFRLSQQAIFCQQVQIKLHVPIRHRIDCRDVIFKVL